MAIGGFFGPDGVGSVTAPELFAHARATGNQALIAYLFKHHHSLPEKAGDQVVLRLLVSLLGTCVEQVMCCGCRCHMQRFQIWNTSVFERSFQVYS